MFIQNSLIRLDKLPSYSIFHSIFNFIQVLVASASGGVWKSTNAGTTWEPIFDKYGSSSIGAVAFFQKDPNIIWVGTPVAEPGTYAVKLKVNGKTYTTKVTVRRDPMQEGSGN